MPELFDKVEKIAKIDHITKRGIVAEFKEFINRGNVVDLAVAFVMGAAFKTVVDSFAGAAQQPGILGGFIGALFGGSQPDFSKKVVTVNGSDIPYGAFVTASLNFFLVSLALFMVVKFYNRFRSTGDDAGDSTVPEPAPAPSDEVASLLREIRDEMRAARGGTASES
jgi:large conductance mechanosensitive channel